MTYLDQFQERDDAAHLREKRQDADAKVREWPSTLYETAMDTYPHLRGTKETCRHSRQALIQSEIDWRREEIAESEKRILELEALL